MAEQRFYTLPEVSEILNISLSQARALVRSGELVALQIGGRNQWRVENTKLEEYIAQAYKKTAESIQSEHSSLSL